MTLLQRLFARRRLDQDLAEEIQQHLDEKIEGLVADGMDRRDAVALAHREFGNRTLIEERGRDVWRWHLVEDLWADLRYAVRQWRRTPAFAIAAIVTLAVGIGANTAVFSLVNGLILRPLPFPNADRLVAVASVDRRTGDGDSLSYPNFFDMRRDTRTLSHFASYRATDMTLTGRGLPVHLRGQIVSWELFQTLDVVPALGRAFVADDEKPGTKVVVLGHETWTRVFGADPAIVSTAITLNGEPHVVAGVAPEGFVFPIEREPTQIWTTLSTNHTSATNEPVTEQRGARMLETIGRLAPGVSMAQAQVEMDAIAASLVRQFPNENANVPTTSVRPEIARLLGPLRPGVLLLWGAVGLVLLLACANVSNLLVARTADREREFDVRLALGGSRGRIVRQLIAENLLLGLAGSAAGIAVAYGVLGVLLPLADGLPRIDQVALDLRVLLFAAGVAVAVTVLVTAAPAARLTRAGRTRALQTTSRTVAEGRQRMRGAVVVAQVAVSLVLLSAATLLTSGLVEVLRRDLGFRPERLMAFDLSISGYEPARRVQFYRDLTERIAAIGGVTRVAAAMPLPLAGHEIGISFSIEGRPTPPQGRPSSDMAIISPGYFQTIGTPVVSGRDFAETDDSGHPRVAIVNRAFADKFFPGQRAIGKRIQPGATGPFDVKGAPMREIVGIVGNAQQSPIAFSPEPIYYLPYAQIPWGASVIVRADLPVETLVPALREAASGLDATAALHGVKTFEQTLARGVSAPRLLVLLMGSFAGIALLLTATGLYGLLAYGVQRRTREFGVRMALGARRPAIVAVVTREALTLVAAGLVIGGAGVIAANAVLRNRMPDVGPPVPWLLAVACGAILLTAITSSVVPARRAAGVNPTEALRAE